MVTHVMLPARPSWARRGDRENRAADVAIVTGRGSPQRPRCRGARARARHNLCAHRADLEIGPPVFALTHAVGIDRHQRAAGNPIDAAIEGAPLRGVVEREEIRQLDLVDRARHVRKRQQRPQGGREDDAPRPMVKEQGSVSEAVAGKCQLPRADVPGCV